MDDLDDKLLSEILLRVPAETLLRSKVINKRWYSLITDPFFILNQAHHSHNNPSGFFHVTSISSSPIGGTIFYLSLDPKPAASSSSSTPIGLPKNLSNERLTILASSTNGLLLILSHNNKDYYICNPTTMKNQLIPEPPFDRHLNSSGLFGLVVINPSSSTSPRLYNFKVICVYKGQLTYGFKIFTPDIELWRNSKKESTISCSQSEIFTDCSSVYYRGALHWLRKRGDILAFHVEKEQSWMIEIPKDMKLLVCDGGGEYPYTWFGVAEDEINLFSISMDKILIWVLDDYENMKWMIRRKINIRMLINCCSNIITTRGSGSGGNYKLPIFYDGDRLVLMVRDKYRFEVHIHNARTGRLISKIKVKEDWLDCCRKFVPHIGTLI